LDEIFEDDRLRGLVRSIMGEINQIAQKKRISLPSDIIDISLKKALLFAKGTETSLQRDMKRKGNNELDLFGKTVVDQGIEFSVPTPVTKQVYEELL